MRSIWAVARHTIAQCLRMKVAVAFLVLLAIMLAALPVVMKGDGTLSGKIRTLLAYGTGITAILLSILTIFLAVNSVASDVESKRIFLLTAKPIARWQYILGRWLGVVTLNAVLLGVAGGAIYTVAQYMRTEKTINANDRRMIETEVFTSRQKVSPLPPRVESAVAERISHLKEEGRYQQALESYITAAGGNEALARKMLDDQIFSEEMAATQSAGVGRSFLWLFKGVKAVGRSRTGAGKVADIDLDRGLIRIEASDDVIGRLIYTGPVQINDVEGKVVRLEDDFFDVKVPLEDARRANISSLTAESSVKILIEPTIQISYRVNPASESIPAKQIPSFWQIRNPTSNFYYQELRDDPARTVTTLIVPSRVVDSEGRCEIQYINMPFDEYGSGVSVEILNSDVSVLFQVDSFEWNYLRGMALILLQLMFLAALGVFAGSFLSFPVGCLLSFAAMPVGLAQEFIYRAVTMGPSPLADYHAIKVIGGISLALLKVLLPNFSQTLPMDFISSGINIPWSYLGQAALTTMAVRGVAALAAACVIFTKRELARVQV